MPQHFPCNCSAWWSCPAAGWEDSDSIYVSLFIFHKHRGICINICSGSHTQMSCTHTHKTRTIYCTRTPTVALRKVVFPVFYKERSSFRKTKKNIVLMQCMTLHIPHSDSNSTVFLTIHPCILALVLNEMCLTFLCGHKPVSWEKNCCNYMLKADV